METLTGSAGGYICVSWDPHSLKRGFCSTEQLWKELIVQRTLALYISIGWEEPVCVTFFKVCMSVESSNRGNNPLSVVVLR